MGVQRKGGVLRNGQEEMYYMTNTYECVTDRCVRQYELSLESTRIKWHGMDVYLFPIAPDRLDVSIYMEVVG